MSIHPVQYGNFYVVKIFRQPELSGTLIRNYFKILYISWVEQTIKTLPHVTISPTISLTMPTSTMEINEIVDDGPATRNDMVNDAGVT